MKTIAHLAPFERNLGDNALNLAIEQMLSDHFLFHRVELVGNSFGKELETTFEEADGIIFGGGGVIHSSSGEGSRKNRDLTGTMWNMDLRRIRKFAAKTCLYAVGFNQFSNEPPPLPVMASFFALLKSEGALLSMRNDGSSKRLGEAFPELRDAIPTIPDPGLLYKGIPGLRKGNYVVIQLATDRLGYRYPDGFDQFIDMLNPVLDKIPYRKILLPHTNADEKTYQAYRDRIHVDEVIPLDLSLDATPKLIGLYSGARFSISTRGHSQLCSIGNQCPSFAISTHPKVKGFFTEIGLTDCLYDHLTEQPDKLQNRFQKFTDRLPDTKRQIQQLCRKFEEQASAFNDRVANFFTGNSKRTTSSSVKVKDWGVVFAADSAYFDGFKVSFNSLRAWHPEWEVTLFDMGLKRKQLEWCKERGIHVLRLKSLEAIEVELIPGQHLNKAAVSSLFTHLAGYRRALYLDVDVIVLGSLDRFREELDNFEFVAVQGSALRRLDEGYEHKVKDEIALDGISAIEGLFPGLNWELPAINTGCFACRAEVFEKWMHFHQLLFRYFVHFRYADQSAVNVLRAAFPLHEKVLPAQYNLTGISYSARRSRIDKRFDLRVVDNRVILKLDDSDIYVAHFSGKTKPWLEPTLSERSLLWRYYDDDFGLRNTSSLQEQLQFVRAESTHHALELLRSGLDARLSRLEKILYAEHLVKLQAYPEALNLFSTALDPKKPSPRTWRGLFVVSMTMGKFQDGLEYLRQYLLLKPDNQEMRRESCKLRLLRTLDLQGSGGEASEILSKNEFQVLRLLRDQRFSQRSLDKERPQILSYLLEGKLLSLVAASGLLAKDCDPKAVRSSESNIDGGVRNRFINAATRFQGIIIKTLLTIKSSWIKDGSVCPRVEVCDHQFSIIKSFTDSPLPSSDESVQDDVSTLWVDPLGPASYGKLEDWLELRTTSMRPSDQLLISLPYLNFDAWLATALGSECFWHWYAIDEIQGAVATKGLHTEQIFWHDSVMLLLFRKVESHSETEKVMDRQRASTITEKQGEDSDSQLTLNALVRSCSSFSGRNKSAEKPVCWYHCCWKDSPNIGDRLIAHETSKLIESMPFFGQRSGTLPLADRSNTDLWSRAADSPLIVIGGGGLFNPDGFPGETGPWSVETGALAKVKAFKILFAIDVNAHDADLYDPHFIARVQSILQHIDAIGVRSRAGLQWLKEHFPSDIGERAFYQPCPTVLINAQRARDGSPLYASCRGKHPVIGLNFAFDQVCKRVGDSLERVLISIREATKEAVRSGASIRVFCHCPEDRMIADYLTLHGVPNTLVDLHQLDREGIYEAYAELDLMAGARLHSLLIPFGIGTPILPMITHPKIRWAASDLGLPFSWDSTSPIASLAEMVNSALNENEAMRRSQQALQKKILRLSDINLARLRLGLERKAFSC